MRGFSAAAILLLFGLLAVDLHAQTAAPQNLDGAGAELATLAKKIDEQNAKIDTLSQHVLRLQKEVEELKGQPGSHSAAAPTNNSATPAPSISGPTHVVTRGETLTSIARMHKVSIADLQKLNRIEDDRKLQIGQTLLIPASASPSVSPTPTPNE